MLFLFIAEACRDATVAEDETPSAPKDESTDRRDKAMRKRRKWWIQPQRWII